MTPRKTAGNNCEKILFYVFNELGTLTIDI